MTSSTHSSRGLKVSQYVIDPLKATNYGFERWSIPDADHGVDHRHHVVDMYGRQAHPYSLYRAQGGHSQATDPHHNLQAILAREASNDRPYLGVDTSGGYSYDTMGVGRANQVTHRGGVGNAQGGWGRLDMQRSSQDMCFDAPQVHRASDSSRASRSLSGAHVAGMYAGN